MTQERDPRKDPKTKDVIRWREWDVRIERLHRGIVSYSLRLAGASKEFGMLAHTYLNTYRGWAKDAEVLNAE